MIKYPNKEGIFMKLTDKDIEQILTLVKINKVILKRYKQAKVSDKRIVANNILPLINMENEILASLNINEEKFKLIRRYFEGKAGVNSTNLLYGTQSNMTDENYAYYRIIAKLKYIVEKNHPNIFSAISAYTTDCEVSFLYRNLLNVETEKESIKKGLEHYAYMILMNSPEIEHQILENGLEPFDTVCDPVDLITDFTAFDALKKITNQLDGCTFSVLHRTSDSLRIQHFSQVNAENSAEMARYLSIYRCRPEDSAYTVMLSTYLQTIIALLEPKRREEIYKAVLIDKTLPQNVYNHFEKLFRDIERKLVPKVTTLSLIPKQTI